ncbi:MAG: hypothetical protein HN348_34135, partial [Proteobacteria bacterium]|nr:hypothetical protein [Pseudomonadota bacterium]
MPNLRSLGCIGPAGVGVILVIIALVWSVLMVRVEFDEFAVRQVYLGPGQGVQEEIH